MTIFPVYGIKELETENGKESGSIVKGEGEGMEKNDFITDVNVTKKKFSKKMKFLLILAILYTGIFALTGTANVFKMLEEETWKSKDIRIVAYNLIAYLFNIMIFISMIRIYASRQFFIRTLSRYFMCIGWIAVGAAFTITHFPTYHIGGFVIMQFGDFVLIDGNMLGIGILFLVFTSLIKEGIQMQKEMDEIL